MSLIGILSDAHGNITGFRLAILHLKKLGVQKFYFLGDALGYIPTVDVVQELIEMGPEIQCILGNHELMILKNKIVVNRDDIYKHKLISEKLHIDQIAFLNKWPTKLSVSIAGTKVLFIHGSPTDVSNGYIYPDTDLTKFIVDEDFVFMGHTHYPFIKQEKGITFVNVGSCGLPRDDGRFGSCATFDSVAKQACIYRFSIDGTLKELSQSNKNQLHESVLELFNRKAKSLNGQLLMRQEKNYD